MNVGKIITWKKGKGKTISPFLLRLGKNMKWGKGEGDGNFRGRKSRFKKGGGEEYQVVDLFP